MASGSYGLPRQTNDIDIVADFGTADLGEFRNRGNSAETALPLDSSCGRFQVRLFPAAAEGFPQSELRRKRYVVSVIPGLTNIELAIASPEDTILAKLVWFRKGGGTCDR